MQQLDLKKFLQGDDAEEGVNPVLNDRFEIRDLIKTTSTSKIYSGYISFNPSQYLSKIGFDIATDNDVIIKYVCILRIELPEQFREWEEHETFLSKVIHI